MTQEINSIKIASQADSTIKQKLKVFNSKFKTDLFGKLPFAGIIIIDLIMFFIYLKISNSVIGLTIAFKGVFHIVLLIATIIFIIVFCWLFYENKANEVLSDIQNYCKTNKFYLNAQAKKDIYKPYLIKQGISIGFMVATIIFILIISVIINNLLSNIPQYTKDFQEKTPITVLSIVFFLSHIIFCFSIANIHIVKRQIFYLKSYSCKCGSMFSFLFSKDYEYSNSTETRSGKYGTREVTVGTAKVDNIDIRLYKNETFEKVAPSEWNVYRSSWTDICCCCGEGKKRDEYSSHKIRDL